MIAPAFVFTIAYLHDLAMLIYYLSLLLFFQQTEALQHSAAIWLDYAALTESSGVCVSAGGQLVWTHNDSGDTPRLFGFRRNGELAVIANLPQASAVDWEDVCSFERNGKGYLAVGDVGDNQKRRRFVTIYVLQEPELGDWDGTSLLSASQRKNQQASEIDVPLAGELKFTYPGGAIDCEGIAYDPRRQTFLLVSKELLRTRLFEVDASKIDGKQTCEATLAGVALVPMVTAADISRDGNLLVLATYGPGCMIRRSADGKWSPAAEDMRFFELPHRKQGESICFDRDGQSLLLTSEFSPSPLYSVPTPDTPLR